VPTERGTQWVAYDLGGVREVPSVSIVRFESLKVETAVKIELRRDGKAYETVDSGTLEGWDANETLRSFSPPDARFTRVSLNSASRDACTSLQEIGIHGGMTTGMRQ
jgi:hypothetical protein